MKLGLRREPGYLRIDGDDFHAALHEVDHPVAIEAFDVRLQRVVSPDEHDFRHFVVGVIVALGELLGGVGNPRRARGGRHAGDARQIACLPGKEARVVGATERPAQTRDVGSNVAPSALREHDRLGAVLLLHVHELLGDEVVRLIPCDALPFILAAVFASALHRVEQAIFVIGHLGCVNAAHAQASLGPRIFRVAFAFHELAVLVGVHDDAAAQVAPWPRPCATARYIKVAFGVLERLLMFDDMILLPHDSSSACIRLGVIFAPLSDFATAGCEAESAYSLALTIGASYYGKNRRIARFSKSLIGYAGDSGGR